MSMTKENTQEGNRIIADIAKALHDTYEDRPIGYFDAVNKLLTLLDQFIPKWVKVAEHQPELYKRVAVRWNSYIDVFEEKVAENTEPIMSHYVPTPDGESYQWVDQNCEMIFIPEPDEYMEIPTTHPYEALYNLLKNK